jgi:hypothetical protein
MEYLLLLGGKIGGDASMSLSQAWNYLLGNPFMLVGGVAVLLGFMWWLLKA